jgi:Tfp pilus assembly protein PilN
VVIGALVAVLAGVTLLVVTSKSISDRKSEVAALEHERDAAQAKLDTLRPFAEFASMQEQRTATVTSLAQSRFDWERVMRELALVLPDDVWLLQLEGTVTPDVTLESGVDVGPRGSVPGPALELVGCTVSQEGVGRFAAALKDIDGVTRVAVFKSERPELSAGDTGGAVSGSAGSASGTTDDCRTRDFITKFEIVAAFDAVPAPEVATPTPVPGDSGTGDESVPTPEQAAAQESVEQGVQEGQETASAVPGT